jgi:hypothetical protein
LRLTPALIALAAAFALLTASASASAPSIEMKQPWQNETLAGWVGVKSTITDDASVQQVEYFVDGQSIGYGTQPPYFSRPWDSTKAPDGQHTVLATAHDSAGRIFSSAPVTFTVKNGTTTATPTVAMKQPWQDETLAGWVGVKSTITDDASVQQVEYLVDGKSIGTGGSAPDYSKPWDSRNVPDGRHTVLATVRDAAGRTFSSPTVTFAVQNGTTSPAPSDTTPPTVTLTSPAEGSAVTGASVLSAQASDNIGVVAVQFSVDGVAVSRLTASPWSASWDSTTVADGAHTIAATAYDAAGNATTSAAVQVTTENAVSTPTSPSPGTCQRPYSDASPWNTPIGSAPAVHANSDYFVSSMTPTLTSDPTQYTYPVYYAESSTATQTIKLSGRYSNVTGPTTIQLLSAPYVAVPIPAAAAAAAGSDAQLIILNPATGDEWGFWQLYKDSSGRWYATNGYHYNTQWSGVPPTGFGSRGAGVPYLAGLVRPCEIAQGRIDHALAFAYDSPTSSFVWPATKSDGRGTLPNEMPEGARLQLDPSLTRDQLIAMGISGPALTVAQALQQYGMYLIDASGREKVMFEYDGTADWNGLITASTVSKIPLSKFRWIDRG